MESGLVKHKATKRKIKKPVLVNAWCVWYLQELDDVAGSKDSMSNGEFEGISGREIGSQDTLLDAPAAEDLAGSARADDHRRRRRGGSSRGRALRG